MSDAITSARPHAWPRWAPTWNPLQESDTGGAFFGTWPDGSAACASAVMLRPKPFDNNATFLRNTAPHMRFHAPFPDGLTRPLAPDTSIRSQLQIICNCRYLRYCK